jgi:hypothetical protein
MLLPLPPLPLPCCNFAADSRVGFTPTDADDGAADAAAVAALLEPVPVDDATLVALLRRPKNPELFFLLLPLFPLLLVDDEELLPEVSTTDPSPPPSPSPDFLRPKPNIFLLA